MSCNRDLTLVVRLPSRRRTCGRDDPSARGRCTPPSRHLLPQRYSSAACPWVSALCPLPPNGWKNLSPRVAPLLLPPLLEAASRLLAHRRKDRYLFFGDGARGVGPPRGRDCCCGSHRCSKDRQEKHRGQGVAKSYSKRRKPTEQAAASMASTAVHQHISTSSACEEGCSAHMNHNQRDVIIGCDRQTPGVVRTLRYTIYCNLPSVSPRVTGSCEHAFTFHRRGRWDVVAVVVAKAHLHLYLSTNGSRTLRCYGRSCGLLCRQDLLVGRTEGLAVRYQHPSSIEGKSLLYPLQTPLPWGQTKSCSSAPRLR